jgi:hypothetical protein
MEARNRWSAGLQTRSGQEASDAQRLWRTAPGARVAIRSMLEMRNALRIANPALRRDLIRGRSSAFTVISSP